MSFFDKLKSGAEHLGQELAKGIAAGRQELTVKLVAIAIVNFSKVQ